MAARMELPVIQRHPDAHFFVRGGMGEHYQINLRAFVATQAAFLKGDTANFCLEISTTSTTPLTNAQLRVVPMLLPTPDNENPPSLWFNPVTLVAAGVGGVLTGGDAHKQALAIHLNQLPHSGGDAARLRFINTPRALSVTLTWMEAVGGDASEQQRREMTSVFDLSHTSLWCSRTDPFWQPRNVEQGVSDLALNYLSPEIIMVLGGQGQGKSGLISTMLNALNHNHNATVPHDHVPQANAGAHMQLEAAAYPVPSRWGETNAWLTDTFGFLEGAEIGNERYRQQMIGLASGHLPLNLHMHDENPKRLSGLFKRRKASVVVICMDVRQLLGEHRADANAHLTQLIMGLKRERIMPILMLTFCDAIEGVSEDETRAFIANRFCAPQVLQAKVRELTQQHGCRVLYSVAYTVRDNARSFPLDLLALYNYSMIVNSAFVGDAADPNWLFNASIRVTILAALFFFVYLLMMLASSTQTWGELSAKAIERVPTPVCDFARRVWDQSDLIAISMFLVMCVRVLSR